jgi:hypothetical protein
METQFQPSEKPNGKLNPITLPSTRPNSTLGWMLNIPITPHQVDRKMIEPTPWTTPHQCISNSESTSEVINIF